MACAAQTISPVSRRVPLAVSRSAEACRTAAAPPLGILPIFASVLSPEEKAKKQEEARKLRWRLARAMRDAIYKRGLRERFSSFCSCSSTALPQYVTNKKGESIATGSPGKVQIHYYGPNNASDINGNPGVGHNPFGHAWLKKCASALLCPVCAPKIRYKRSLEIRDACRKMIEKGYSWVFVTFTAPHDLSTDPKFQVQTFQKCMQALKSGEWWQNFSDYWKWDSQIRAVELTDDHPDATVKTGCHWHAHLLVFLDRPLLTENECMEMQDKLASKWVKLLVKKGLCPESKKEDALKHAVKVSPPRQPKKSKNKKISPDEAVEYLCKGAGCEISPGISVKVGRKTGRISHWELFFLAFLERPELIPRALAVMSALKGRPWLRWSDGLKLKCGLSGSDKGDDDIDALVESEGVEVYQYEKMAFKSVDARKGQFEVLARGREIAKRTGCDLTWKIPWDQTELKKHKKDIDKMKSAFVRAVYSVVRDVDIGGL